MPLVMPKIRPICPYCGKEAEFVGGDVIYPHRPDLHEKKFWRCSTGCDAYVGCHQHTAAPFGTLANAELRRARNTAHRTFDQIWRDHRAMKRKEAYAWLAEQLGISVEDCHIGAFDEDQCRRATDLANQKLVELNEARSWPRSSGC